MHHILESDKPAAAAIGLLKVAQSNKTFDWGIIEEAGRAHGFDLVLPTLSAPRGSESGSCAAGRLPEKQCPPARE